MKCLTCRAARAVWEFAMRSKNPGRLEHQQKILQKRASIAKLQDQIRNSRIRLVTARAELKQMRSR
jgi:hypothetical protein